MLNHKVANISHIAIIQSVSLDERQTGYDLYNDCVSRRIDYMHRMLKGKNILIS
jgi:hypothetical protein